MSVSDESSPIPASIARVLAYFAGLSRDEKMQALVQYSRKLEPLPTRFADVDRGQFTVSECQTRVDIFPEFRNGRMHFYADIDARRSPTIAAVLAIVFSAVNEQPPAATLSIPGDFVRTLMSNIGLGAREAGLTAIVARLKRYAAEAEARAA